MGLIISDPKTGVSVEVNSDNKLEVRSVMLSEFAHRTEKGDAYAWTSVSADIDAGDTPLLVCNNSTTRKLYIEKIYLWADVATQFKIHVPSYPTLAGTAVVGVNLNMESNKVADAVAYRDETGNTFAETNVITTVRNTYYSRGNGDDNADIPAAGFGQWVNYNGVLRLGYHQCVAVDLIAETGAYEVCIMGYFKDA